MVGKEDAETAGIFQIGVDDGDQLGQREFLAMFGEILCLGSGGEITFEEGRIGNDEIEFLGKRELAYISRINFQRVLPFAGRYIFFQLLETGKVQFDPPDLSLMPLRQHEHKEAGAAADIQRERVRRDLGGEPGAEDTGIRAHFKGALVLVDGKLLELKIRVRHER